MGNRLQHGGATQNKTSAVKGIGETSQQHKRMVRGDNLHVKNSGKWVEERRRRGTYMNNDRGTTKQDNGRGGEVRFDSKPKVEIVCDLTLQMLAKKIGKYGEV